MTPKNEPQVTKELVSFLERTFPDRCPTPEMPEREIWMAAGAARVVTKLRHIHAEQVRKDIGG